MINMILSCIFLAMMPCVPQPAPTIYNYKVTSIDGGTIDLASFKGKKILIVNVASECGYTPQYEELEKLYRQYRDQLVIIGFPANDFMGQEPGSNQEILQFCTSKYDVTFPLATKISVKGADMAPIYHWLTEKKLNGVEDSEVSWNFNKYLVNESGEYVCHFKSKVAPFDPALIAAIEK
ncbi:MAG: glutathione peroxidase [Chitinophagales bacterium]|nr:glutathione peroxidase [Chitinophagales bacterium]